MNAAASLAVRMRAAIPAHGIPRADLLRQFDGEPRPRVEAVLLNLRRRGAVVFAGLAVVPHKELPDPSEPEPRMDGMTSAAVQSRSPEVEKALKREYNRRWNAKQREKLLAAREADAVAKDPALAAELAHMEPEARARFLAIRMRHEAKQLRRKERKAQHEAQQATPRQAGMQALREIDAARRQVDMAVREVRQGVA